MKLGRGQIGARTMKKLLLSGVALAALTVGPANAADLGRPPPAPVPVPAYIPFSWTGFYIGGNAGVAWGPKGGFSDSFGNSFDGVSQAPYSLVEAKSVLTIRSTTGWSPASKQISTGFQITIRKVMQFSSLQLEMSKCLLTADG